MPPAADLAAPRLHPFWPAGIFAVTFLVYLAFLPRFLLYSSPPTGDQPFYLMDVASLAQDGDLNVKNNYDQHDEVKFYDLAPHPPGFVGMSAPRPLGRQLANAVARPAGEEYSFHLPGLPVLLLPAWIGGAWFALWWPATLVMLCALGALVAVNSFLLAHEVSGRLPVALAVWLPIAFSGPVMTYSYLIFTELPAGLLLIYAFRRLARGWQANGAGRRVLIGVCLGYLPWLAWRAVPITVALLAYAAVQWWRAYGAGGDAPQGARPSPARALWPMAWFVAPVGLSAALLAAYNLFLFGQVVPATGVMVGSATDIFYWPWAGPDALAHFVTAAFGQLFDIQWGLLIYTPVYVLAGAGLIALFRQGRGAGRRLLGWMALVAVPYLLVATAFYAWNGLWCPPGRYLSTFVPLLAAPLALAFVACRAWLYRVLYAGLALAGLATMAVMLIDPIRFWPFGDGRLFYGGVFDWVAHAPESPLHLDLTHVLPSFITPDEAHQPAATAAVIGLAFGLVFLCALSIRRPRPVAPGRPWRRVVPGLVWLAAAGAVGAGWFDINAPYLKPQTLLAEQHRWPLAQPLVEAHSIAYLAGKIYIASLGPRSAVGVLQAGAGELGALDLQTGAYTRIALTAAGGAVPYAYPGAVVAGADGTLTLLNNGPGDQALLGLQPDGRVVRQWALTGKTPLALGLAFGPDGKIYATDLGRIHQFAPTGGPELAAWGGLKNGFNNIFGVAVDPAGRIYGAESSEKRIQVLDPSGHFLRAYALSCQPFQMAVQGAWIDIACDGGVRSINWQTGEAQTARLRDADPPWQTPVALTYGPDGTLYLLDTGAVIAYHVQH